MTAVAFTGPTTPRPESADRIRQIISGIEADTYITGAAFGVDTICGWAAIEAFPGAYHVVCVPYGYPHNQRLVREFTRLGAEIVLVHGGYMKRNDELIRRADHLYGFPATGTEVLRSGTWSTIRRARRRGIGVELFALDEIGIAA